VRASASANAGKMGTMDGATRARDDDGDGGRGHGAK
jgi:hypothetical protein